MGVMMWMMMRGGKGTAEPQAGSEAELSRMRADIDQLRGEQHGVDTTGR